ncbi:hypothetical protein Gpo141_00012120 [Globisporangium polare]
MNTRPSPASAPETVLFGRSPHVPRSAKYVDAIAISKWHIGEGDESGDEGYIAKIFVQEGASNVSPNQPLAVIVPEEDDIQSFLDALKANPRAIEGCVEPITAEITSSESSNSTSSSSSSYWQRRATRTAEGGPPQQREAAQGARDGQGLLRERRRVRRGDVRQGVLRRERAGAGGRGDREGGKDAEN